MNSRVHPKYKTKYRITNWVEYDKALIKRGDITLWISEGNSSGAARGPACPAATLWRLSGTRLTLYPRSH